MDKIYTHGGDIYRENVKNKIKYDFSININPLGMPESVAAAAKLGVELSDRYPDYKAEKLCGRLSEKLGCRAENIVIGNGAAELIYALCIAEKPAKAYIPVPAFSEYEAAVRALSGAIVYIGADNAFEDKSYHDKIISAVKAHNPDEGGGILFMSNPNNPTGYLFDKSTLTELAKSCEEKNIRLVLDECFIEFTDKKDECTLVHELETYKHLVILRAFTKIYAMPGLRLGYMLTADMDLTAKVKSVLQPWNTSVPAQMAGCAALEEDEYLAETVSYIKRERTYLETELSGIKGIHVYPSDANYIMFSLISSSKEGGAECVAERTKNTRKDGCTDNCNLHERLLEHGILIRNCDDYKGLAHETNTCYYRIAVRKHDENAELIRIMKEVLLWQNP